MDIEIFPSRLRGDVNAPPSKSHMHRLLICAALSSEKTTLSVPGLCDTTLLASVRTVPAPELRDTAPLLASVRTAPAPELRDTAPLLASVRTAPAIPEQHDSPLSSDLNATLSCLAALGCGFTVGDGTVEVTPLPRDGKRRFAELDCRESASTLRFLLPLAPFFCEKARFVGRGSLPRRPLKPYRELLSTHGMSFYGEELPLEVSGGIDAGEYRMPGDISSQYVSGLLFALPLCRGTSRIILTSGLQSAGYVGMTLSALRAFGVEADETHGSYIIRGGQSYSSRGKCSVEGDWSSAAFFIAANSLGGQLEVTGLSDSSEQGDRSITALLRRIEEADGKALTLDVQNTPDLLPILAVRATFGTGETVFTGAGRLRYKESDRLRTTAELINALGGVAREESDSLRVEGRTTLAGGATFDCHGDHRLAMSAAIAASFCENSVIICGADAVNKSYPGFFGDFKLVGGKYNVI